MVFHRRMVVPTAPDGERRLHHSPRYSPTRRVTSSRDCRRRSDRRSEPTATVAPRSLGRGMGDRRCGCGDGARPVPRLVARTLRPTVPVRTFPASAHVNPYNTQISDLIREIIPWTTLAWTQVHHGILPLWNPYSALGAPLAFNWQSGAFSLPALVGYLSSHCGSISPCRCSPPFSLPGQGCMCSAGSCGSGSSARPWRRRCSSSADRSWPCSGWPIACGHVVGRMAVRLLHSGRPGRASSSEVPPCSPWSWPCPSMRDSRTPCRSPRVVARVPHRRVGATAPPVRVAGRSCVPALDLAIAAIAGLGLAAPLCLPAAAIVVGIHSGGGSPRRLSHRLPAERRLPEVQRTVARRPDLLQRLQYQRLQLRTDSCLRRCHRRRPRRRGAGHHPPPAGHRRLRCRGGGQRLSRLSARLSSRSSTNSPALGEVRWVRAIQVLVFALAILAGAGLDALARSRGNRSVRNCLGAGFGVARVLLLLRVGLRSRSPLGRGHHHPLEELRLAGGRGRARAWSSSGSSWS